MVLLPLVVLLKHLRATDKVVDTSPVYLSPCLFLIILLSILHAMIEGTRFAHADCRHSPILSHLVYVKYMAMSVIERVPSLVARSTLNLKYR